MTPNDDVSDPYAPVQGSGEQATERYGVAALARVRALHRASEPHSDDGMPRCSSCAVWWPCPTVKAMRPPREGQ